MPEREADPLALLQRAWPPGLAGPAAVTRLKGGFVADTWTVTLDDGRQVIAKRGPYPAAAEADGLDALARSGLPTPAVLGTHGSTLVLEQVGRQVSAPTDRQWATLGAQVAGMHLVTFPRFGWHRDNHAGRFLQPNPWGDHWPDFFAAHRVRTHLDDPAVPAVLRRRLLAACEGPIQASLRPDPPAVLTHGDLWSGNIIAGRWIVDPEVSAADRELDLAYMEMSSRAPLPDAFWAGYRERLGLPDGYHERRPILQLHHRLLQIRHFGVSQVPHLLAALDHLGW